MEYTGRLYGEGGILLMLTAQDVDALESMRSRLCAALGLPADSTPETVAEAVEARRVVVPDDDRPSREFLENYVEGFDPGERSAALFGWREGRRHLREHSRAIPADRVLGEGMVAVPREEWERLQKFERDTKETDSRDCSDCAHYRRSQSCPGCTHPESPQNEYAFDWLLAQRCEFYAIRANQGGAAT